jgi:hypothetical protein
MGLPRSLIAIPGAPCITDGIECDMSTILDPTTLNLRPDPGGNHPDPVSRSSTSGLLLMAPIVD